MPSKPRIYMIERIISSASYLTLGMAGFIWLIIATLLKKRVTDFIMYHIMQSIFLSMAYFIIVMISKLPPVQFLYMILYKIPLINLIPYFINMPLPLFVGLSLFQVLKLLVILYLAGTSFMGIYTYIPYVSYIVKGKSAK